MPPAGDLAQTATLYAVWALGQQAIFQFYFLGRLQRGLPRLPVPALILLNGCAYGLVHLPDVRLAALTSVAGVVWTRVYYRDRLLLPLALSHALLGTAWYALPGAH